MSVATKVSSIRMIKFILVDLKNKELRIPYFVVVHSRNLGFGINFSLFRCFLILLLVGSIRMALFRPINSSTLARGS